MIPTLTLAATAFNKQQLIEPEAPQVALAGRSNVGKSSLVNALASRKQLAKTSATPGKTRSINYYMLDTPVPSFLVDLPGYGYARCSKEERLKWAKLMEYYLSATPGLTALAVLIDSRLPPQKLDRDLVAFARSIALPFIPVLTKIDKAKQSDVRACLEAWQKEVGGDTPFILTSSTKKQGIDTLWNTLLEALDLHLPQGESFAVS